MLRLSRGRRYHMGQVSSFGRPKRRESDAGATTRKPLTGKNGEVREYASVQDGLDAVMSRDIDLFVGSVTKTPEREKNGLRFTNGYYSFETKLYGRSGQADIWKWAGDSKALGVGRKDSLQR